MSKRMVRVTLAELAKRARYVTYEVRRVPVVKASLTHGRTINTFYFILTIKLTRA